ncbi:uroplakin-3b-like [Sceloporus undulatus]|uniref:uroplakin-3b-like n=1 Tax=Sceloporus undulatus TaxID=8520 RepID=UPI001C4DD173|nr:uroplakin-3b-like [Sceloporus undulatus]XP_042298815.1 uroplakin-3b-like [Sceloporus undulatus]
MGKDRRRVKLIRSSLSGWKALFLPMVVIVTRTQDCGVRSHLPLWGEEASLERRSILTKMTLLHLLLFLGFAGKTSAQIEAISYTPRISDLNMEGKITASTFALEPPSCIFDQVVNASDTIWVVVTYSNATFKFKNPTTPKDVPTYEELYTTYGYMTMKATLDNYPCKKGQAGRVLRIGNESSCKNDDSRTHCNGPLPSPGPFRVKFLAMDTKGSIAETRWSASITLQKALAWKTLDTWPGRREGDMIVITVILSALCGVVTIGFLGTVIYECVKTWRQPDENQQEPRQDPEPSFQGSRYDTHHIPPAPPVPPPPPSADVPSPQLISTSH